MIAKTLGRIAGILALTIGLAGCVDVAMDIEVLSDTQGKATTVATMRAEFYAMAKADQSAEGFCKEAGATLTENADGSATCVLVVEGAFADLKLDDGGDGAQFAVVSPGLVKVSVNTGAVTGKLGLENQDEETKQMLRSFFDGHSITIRIKGREITDTNLTLSADRTSAEIVIPFLDLINSTLALPAELYAIIKTN